MYLLQRYPPSIWLQCWQTCRNKQGCVPAPTLCSFDIAAMLTNLQKQTRMCICSNINPLLSCCNFDKRAETNKDVFDTTLSSFHLATMLANLQKQTKLYTYSNIIRLHSCYNVGKLAETNKDVYLLQNYPPANLLQCWKTSKNKQGCVPASTLSSFYLAAMLVNLQKQTTMCICSNIILLPPCCNVGKLAEINKGMYLAPTLSSFYHAVMLANFQKQTRVCTCSNIILLLSCCNVGKLSETNKGCVSGSNIIFLPSCCNVGKLAETNKGVYLLQHYPPSILLQCWETLQKQTRMCICSNIILLLSCCNVGKLAVTNKGVYLLQQYPPSILKQCWEILQKQTSDVYLL